MFSETRLALSPLATFLYIGNDAEKVPKGASWLGKHPVL